VEAFITFSLDAFPFTQVWLGNEVVIGGKAKVPFVLLVLAMCFIHLLITQFNIRSIKFILGYLQITGSVTNVRALLFHD
jgi:hypothetical protein